MKICCEIVLWTAVNSTLNSKRREVTRVTRKYIQKFSEVNNNIGRKHWIWYQCHWLWSLIYQQSAWGFTRTIAVHKIIEGSQMNCWLRHVRKGNAENREMKKESWRKKLRASHSYREKRGAYQGGWSLTNFCQVPGTYIKKNVFFLFSHYMHRIGIL